MPDARNVGAVRQSIVRRWGTGGGSWSPTQNAQYAFWMGHQHLCGYQGWKRGWATGLGMRVVASRVRKGEASPLHGRRAVHGDPGPGAPIVGGNPPFTPGTRATRQCFGSEDLVTKLEGWVTRPHPHPAAVLERAVTVSNQLSNQFPLLPELCGYHRNSCCSVQSHLLGFMNKLSCQIFPKQFDMKKTEVE